MASYEEECLEGLQKKHLSPGCDEIPTPSGWPRYHCAELLNMDTSLHKTCQEEGVPLLPVPSVACIKVENGEPKLWKYFEEEVLIEKCEELHSSDKSWKLKSATAAAPALPTAP